jgi:hypothetical protein
MKPLNQKPFVQVDSIKVNAIETNSGIFVGTNTHINWSSISNQKSGFGSITGHYNAVVKNFNLFSDDDGIDTPIHSYTGIAPD